MREPQTDTEFKEAANAAAFYLLLESARQYGLVRTDTVVNVDRCDEILKRAKERGIIPDSDDQLCERFMKVENT